jgi:heterodisulfide reductase subunit C
MAEEMEFRPHDILRLIQRNQGERLFANASAWLCLTCETCTARCPNEVDPARIIDALRELMLQQKNGVKPPRSIIAFHRAFLKQIRAHGRIFEFGLVASYKMRSGKLFSDVDTVPGMIQRGKLPLTPRKISGIADVRRIIDECLAQGAKGAQEVEPS